MVIPVWRMTAFDPILASIVWEEQDDTSGQGSVDPVVAAYPANISANDIIIYFVGLPSSVDHTVPTGFTNFGGWTQNFRCYRAGWRRADGTESGNFNINLTGLAVAAWRVVRVSGAHLTEVPARPGGAASASSTAPNPPAKTIPWGTSNSTLMFALAEWDGGNVAATGYPTNYVNGRSNGLISAGSEKIALASRILNAVSEDPGAFSLNATTTWVADAFCIRSEIN